MTNIAAKIKRLRAFIDSLRAQPPRPIPDCVPLSLNLDDLDKGHASLGDLADILDALEEMRKALRDLLNNYKCSCNHNPCPRCQVSIELAEATLGKETNERIA